MIELNKAPKDMDENEIAAVVIDIAFKMHRKWGPGLLERVFEELLVHHLQRLGFDVQQQKPVPFDEDGVFLDAGFRADVIVKNKVIVELKSVEKISPVFLKILLTYWGQRGESVRCTASPHAKNPGSLRPGDAKIKNSRLIFYGIRCRVCGLIQVIAHTSFGQQHAAFGPWPLAI